MEGPVSTPARPAHRAGPPFAVQGTSTAPGLPGNCKTYNVSRFARRAGVETGPSARQRQAGHDP